MLVKLPTAEMKDRGHSTLIFRVLGEVPFSGCTHEMPAVPNQLDDQLGSSDNPPCMTYPQLFPTCFCGDAEIGCLWGKGGGSCWAWTPSLL